MTTREWRLGHEPSWTVRLTASALRTSSAMLTRVARKLRARRTGVAAAAPVYEFHAEAGAPEGALYVDGVLVGHLQGVSRL